MAAVIYFLCLNIYYEINMTYLRVVGGGGGGLIIELSHYMRLWDFIDEWKWMKDIWVHQYDWKPLEVWYFDGSSFDWEVISNKQHQQSESYFFSNLWHDFFGMKLENWKQVDKLTT